METTSTGRVIRSYRQTVESKYLPNSRTIKVKCNGGYSKTYGWNDCLEVAENHALAIEKFLDFMEWSGTYSIGSNVAGTGYVAVWVGA